MTASCDDSWPSKRQVTIDDWYNEMGEDEMLRQIHAMIQSRRLPPLRARNGNFTDSFNIDVICCFASFADDGRTCVGMRSLAMSCKKYSAMSDEMWYGIIKERALRNQCWVWR